MLQAAPRAGRVRRASGASGPHGDTAPVPGLPDRLRQVFAEREALQVRPDRVASTGESLVVRGVDLGVEPVFSDAETRREVRKSACAGTVLVFCPDRISDVLAELLQVVAGNCGLDADRRFSAFSLSLLIPSRSCGRVRHSRFSALPLAAQEHRTDTARGVDYLLLDELLNKLAMAMRAD